MNQGSRTLVELLLAAILLVLVGPQIEPLVWRHFGPDPVEYAKQLELNRAAIAHAEHLATLKQIATDLKNTEAKLRAQTAAMRARNEQAERERIHNEAMKLHDAFSDRQANLYAACLTETKGKINQQERDGLIEAIWMSSPSITTCDRLRFQKLEELKLRERMN